MIRKILLGVFLAGCLLAGIAGLVAVNLYPAPGPLNADKLFYIAPATPTRIIADNLAAEGIFDAMGERIFLVAVKLNNAKLKAGEFDIKQAASIKDVLTTLSSGKNHQRMVTIPEGLTSFEIVEIVNKADAMEGVIEGAPAEGSLLPETYSYVRGDKRSDIIGRMQKGMQETIQRLWQQRAENLPITTPEEAVILASVVEKETGVATERARVAGVFTNRLRIGMPLQSDPTVIYAVTEGKGKLDRSIYRKDLNIDSPYNTYLHTGLPPTPIANPGLQSLEAVLHPEANDFLYFVADGTGGHAFAKDLDDHVRNVSKWRALQRNEQ